ncbi:hypothetical protein PT2222_50124 [Paraburkholderia tropica]
MAQTLVPALEVHVRSLQCPLSDADGQRAGQPRAPDVTAHVTAGFDDDRWRFHARGVQFVAAGGVQRCRAAVPGGGVRAEECVEIGRRRTLPGVGEDPPAAGVDVDVDGRARGIGVARHPRLAARDAVRGRRGGFGGGGDVAERGVRDGGQTGQAHECAGNCAGDRRDAARLGEAASCHISLR